MAKPETLEQLYRKAVADVGAGGPAVCVEWAFIHAKAVASQTIAIRQLAHLENRDRDAHIRAGGVFNESMIEAILKDAPSPQEIQNATEIVEETTAWVTASEQVIALLARPRPVAAKPVEAPKEGTRFAVAQGGRK